MMKNSTLSDNTTTTVDLSLINYDTNGAMIYIIIVLLWYSIGIVFLLGMDILARSEEIEDSIRHQARFRIRNLRDHTNTKEILGKIIEYSNIEHFLLSEELVDKQNRARLWDIYLGTRSDTKDGLFRAETIRIRHIEKQLATITRNYRLTHDILCPSADDLRFMRSRSNDRSERSQSKATSTLQRRPSLDQQTLDRWKELADLSKSYEQSP
jgi:hypothetical protein